jgi:hypothetical protein
MTRRSKLKKHSAMPKSKRSMMPRSRAMYGFIEDDWDNFRQVCNRRWSKYYENLMDGSFSFRKVLGSGYYGIVLETSCKKLVVKVTSDADEGYFNMIVLEDDYLRYSPGLPFILDCFHIPEWGAYVILREDVKFGLEKLPESSPLARSINILDRYGEEAMRIESKVSTALRALDFSGKGMTKSNFVYGFKEAQGLMRTEIIKAMKKLPNVSPNSKYFYAMEVIVHALDKYGIALWDLHELNLGKHKHDLSDIIDYAPPLDKESVLILDVGGNFGSPIMSQMIDSIDI